MSLRVLALDTATEACSVAVLTEDGLFSMFEDVGRGHAEQILRMVDGTLAKAGIALGSLDGIAASIGPGSFTGVRISVSVAQGLAFGAGVPVVAVNTLEALAAQALRVADDAGAVARVVWASGGAAAAPISCVLACLDARMGEVYWGCFAADAARGVAACGAPAVSAPAAVSVPFAAGFHGIGRGFAAYAALEALPGLLLPPGAADALPDARDMVRLGSLRLAAGEGLDAAQLAPLYLRDKVALTELERAAVKAARLPP